MARPLRIQVAGGIYHVTARGVRGEPMFVNDADRRVWRATLAETCRRTMWKVHSYAQLGNHYHLVVETPKPNISVGMQYLGGTYAIRFNHAHSFCGHLQHRRFDARLIENDQYALEVARYVALNPVRAGLCQRPEDWAWASYRAVIGLEPPDVFVDIDRTLRLFGDNRETARDALRAFVEDAIRTPPPLRVQPTLAMILGTGTPAQIRSAHLAHGYTLAEIADHLGVSTATVHRRVRHG
jgi:REP-associated tyrosine transposase